RRRAGNASTPCATSTTRTGSSPSGSSTARSRRCAPTRKTTTTTSAAPKRSSSSTPSAPTASSRSSRRGRWTDPMKQRVSLLTLGVANLDRARAFYEALGWETGAAPGDDVAFFQAGGMVVALWDRAKLAEDSCVEDPGGWGGITLALNLGSPAEV